MGQNSTSARAPIRKKVLASNGYILIFLGKDHHLSDCRGYVYEHRFVAEQVLGRRLKKHELVHHKDGVKTNNSPDNLEVCSDHASHFFHHRKRDRGLKLPDEENHYVLCKCGCGTSLLKYDTTNRPREYVAGHNPQNSPTTDAILTVLSLGPRSVSALSHSTGIPMKPIKTTLSKLTKKGVITRIKRGIYGDNNCEVEHRENPLIRCACGCKKKFRKYDSSWRERKFVSGHNMRKLSDPEHLQIRQFPKI